MRGWVRFPPYRPGETPIRQYHTHAGTQVIGNWELADFTPAQGLFAFADAYLRSSRKLCGQLARRKHGLLYPEASVVMFLARHAVELFLKGALAARTGRSPVHHNIDDLADDYATHFPEPEFAWRIPFTSEYPGMLPGQIKKARKHSKSDQLVRYPITKNMRDWSAVVSFGPVRFLEGLKRVEVEFRDLEEAYRQAAIV